MLKLIRTTGYSQTLKITIDEYENKICWDKDDSWIRREKKDYKFEMMVLNGRDIEF